ncbi:hypothetical protein [Calothrix sp. NIES-3974]|uniref:hypothetical protein n=1 Tax=Calothrix sp. NIES-3974 TaxID=2005462 RepID=UPI000B5E9AC7|nr:hypothetical protein [Calothrix sp. NIES-3974]BAZ03563.1 hypothetical protein NIES3974_01920 [Calothrix sp. NIES-3974]
MASIKVAELRPAGSELFQDSESFMNELNEMDTLSVHGGYDSGYGVFTNYLFLGYKDHLAYDINKYAIGVIAGLASKFNFSGYYYPSYY